MPAMEPLNLDHHATTPLLPEAGDAMRALAESGAGNPASAHRAGRAARRALEDAREAVARLLDAGPDEVVFTSGATEANNLALFGLLRNPSPGPSPGKGGETEPIPAPPPFLGEGVGGRGSSPHLLASPVEHPCVAEPLKHLAGRGFTLETLPVSPRGVVPADALTSRLRPDTRLVSVMLANHETGAIQPVRALAAACPAGVHFHTDAAQAVGKIPVSFRTLGVTALTASAHKFRGPPGVGVLLLKRNTPLRPLLFGGPQQGGRRPGTEPVAPAVGLAVALEHAVRHLETHRAKLEALRSRLWGHLRETAAPVVLNGPEPGSADGLPTALNVSFPGCRADVLLMALDLAGVLCSVGSACSSGSLQPSPVLAAMGVPDAVLRSAVRFTLGPTLTEGQIDDAGERIAAAVRRVRE